MLLSALLELTLLTGCATQQHDSLVRPKRQYSKTILISTVKSEENWQTPWWRRILHNFTHPETARLTDKKNLVVELVEKRAEMVVGKVVSGASLNKDDPRYQRDKVMGRGRKIWGVLFRLRF